MNSKKLCYIAGKVTGLPEKEVFEKFKHAETILDASGYITINPTALIPFDLDWNEAMRISLGLLVRCDCIYLLPDWRQSRGAVIEHSMAMSLNLPIISRIIDPLQSSIETDANKDFIIYNATVDAKPEAIERHQKVISKIRTLQVPELLEFGVILVRPSQDRSGNPIIEQRTSDQNWHTRISFTKPIARDKMLNRLIQQEKMYRLETSNMESVL